MRHVFFSGIALNQRWSVHLIATEYAAQERPERRLDSRGHLSRVDALRKTIARYRRVPPPHPEDGVYPAGFFDLVERPILIVSDEGFARKRRPIGEKNTAKRACSWTRPRDVLALEDFVLSSRFFEPCARPIGRETTA
jgi:hypothetical protein